MIRQRVQVYHASESGADGDKSLYPALSAEFGVINKWQSLTQ